MAKNQFAAAHFHDEEAARQWFEAARWPNGPICPRCGSDKNYATKKLGRYRCGAPTCRKDFTVMTGTVMERSHAKLTQWAAAFHMAASSKKGFSALQLCRELGCQYNTAWFLHHRVMEAMRRGGLDLPPLGGEGKVVEADETYFGDIPEAERRALKTTGRPYSKEAAAQSTSGQSLRLSSAAARFGHFRSRSACWRGCRYRAQEHRARKPFAYRRKQSLSSASVRNLPRTKPSSTLTRNMRAAT